MGDGFRRHKKKILIEAIIKSVAFSMSLGLIIISAFWIASKLLENNSLLVISIPIASAITSVSMAVLFLILRPRNMKLAKRLDKECELNEKVQTMLEFKDNDNVVTTIQREDTNKRLLDSNIKLKIKHIPFYIIVLVLGLASIITSICIPAKASEEPPYTGPIDPGYETEKWQIVAIKDLIDHVNRSELEDDMKTAYVSELNTLLLAVENVEKLSEMKSSVNDCITGIELKLDLKNTNNEIYPLIKDSLDPTIRSFSVYIYTLDAINSRNYVDTLKRLDSLDSLGDPALVINLNDIYWNLGYVLEQGKSLILENDPLYNNIINLTKELYNMRNDSDAAYKLKTITDKYKYIIEEEVAKQAINRDEANYVIEKLIEIFDLKEDYETPEDEVGTDETDTSTSTLPEENEGDQGGLGDGEMIYGSDDLFYDPDLGVVQYGEVIAQYYAYIDSLINDGAISEEAAANLKHYFSILFGTEEENE